MDNSLMIGMSTQQMLRERMDIIANNLANMNTTGFKVESVVQRPLTEKPAEAVDNPNPITFAEGWRLQRDMSTGPMERTGNTFDIAIASEGFFAVSRGEDTFYSRDGRFHLDEGGRLVTRAGLPVQGRTVGEDGFYVEGEGGEIQIEPEGGPVNITKDGVIMQDNQEVARLNIVAFDNPAALEKRGGNLYAATDEKPRQPVAVRVEQGFLEGSNVQAVLELTRMIEVSRAYTSVAKMINESDGMREQAINKLASVR